MSEEAKLDFTADDKVARAAIDRLTKQVAGLEEQQRKLNETAKKGAHESRQAVDEWAKGLDKLSDAGRKALVHSDETWKRGLANLKQQNDELKKHGDAWEHVTHWVSEQGKELIAIGGSYLAIHKAVDLVVEGYSQWREHVKKLGEEHQQLAESTVKTLHQAGILKFGKEAEEFIASGAGGVASPEEVRQAMSGVAAGAPNASFDEMKTLAAQTAKSAPLGVNLAERGTFMAKLHAIDKSKSPDDLADIASFAQQAAGNRAGELTSPAMLRSLRALTAGGMGIDEALGLSIGALQNDAQMKQFTKVGELLDQENKFAPSGNPHRLTPEERLKQQFGRLSSEDRLKELMAGGKMARAVAGDESFKLRMIPADQQADILRRLREAQSGNLATAEVEQLGDFGYGTKAVLAAGERTAQGLQAETPEAQFATIFEKYQSYQKANASGLRGNLARWGNAFAEDVNYAGSNIPGLEQDVQNRRGQGWLTQQQASELLQALAKLKESIDNQARETKRNTATGGPARANVNGHNEGAH
jgi:hypothetical protein